MMLPLPHLLDLGRDGLQRSHTTGLDQEMSTPGAQLRALQHSHTRARPAAGAVTGWIVCGVVGGPVGAHGGGRRRWQRAPCPAAAANERLPRLATRMACAAARPAGPPPAMRTSTLILLRLRSALIQRRTNSTPKDRQSRESDVGAEGCWMGPVWLPSVAQVAGRSKRSAGAFVTIEQLNNPIDPIANLNTTSIGCSCRLHVRLRLPL